MLTELDLPTEQQKRQHSANHAMAHRQWSITDVPGGWLVKTQRDTYTIIPRDGRLICSCPDHKRYASFGLDCKHIRGLLIFLDEGGSMRDSQFL